MIGVFPELNLARKPRGKIEKIDISLVAYNQNVNFDKNKSDQININIPYKLLLVCH